MTQTQPRHIPWLDVLRITACFMVVLAHCCDPFVAKFDADRTEFLSGAFWGSLMRASVPLFVMISGVLLLPVRLDTGAFYRRRLSRILWPLVVWSLVTPLFYWAYGHSEAANTGYNLVTWILNFNYTTTPLWYLYMLVGIYLILPIISPWLAQASQREIKRFLCIWGITLFIPYIRVIAPLLGYVGNYGHTGILGECAWNPFGTFYYFSGFIGYIVLAFYLNKFPSKSSRSRILTRSALLFVLGYALTFGSFVLTQKFYPTDYNYLEIPWFFTSFNVFLMTYALFTAMQTIRVESEKCQRRLCSIAGLTFGIYLSHFFVVQVGYDLVYEYIPLPPYLQIPVIAIAAFSVTAGVVWLLQRIPKHKYLIG